MSSGYGNELGQITVPEHPPGISIHTYAYPVGGVNDGHSTLPTGHPDNDGPRDPDGPIDPVGPCGATPVHTPRVAAEPDGPCDPEDSTRVAIDAVLAITAVDAVKLAVTANAVNDALVADGFSTPKGKKYAIY
jgi:hypothetical protein